MLPSGLNTGTHSGAFFTATSDGQCRCVFDVFHHKTGRDPAKACERVISQVYAAADAHGVKPFVRLTCVFSDGETLYGFRHASDGRCPSLYASNRFSGGATVVASEPLDGIVEHWTKIEPDCLMSYSIEAQNAPQMIAPTLGTTLRDHTKDSALP